MIARWRKKEKKQREGEKEMKWRVGMIAAQRKRG